MSLARSNRRSSFGVTCDRCSHELIAPEWSEYRSERHVHHVWRCWKCDWCFETIVDTKTTREFI
jgi:RNase P subunit RPR2